MAIIEELKQQLDARIEADVKKGMSLNEAMSAHYSEMLFLTKVMLMMIKMIEDDSIILENR